MSWRIYQTSVVNFHDHEFSILTNGLIDRGQRDKARDVLSLGIKACPGASGLEQAQEELGFGTTDGLPPVLYAARLRYADVLLEPVKTRLFEDDNPVQIMKEYVIEPRPEDIATLSSCVAGLMEGRILWKALWNQGFWQDPFHVL